MIQKIAGAFGLEPDPFPRGEIYLSDDELAWAWSIRGQLPRNRPVLLLSAGSVTDSLKVSPHTLLWQDLVEMFGRRFTVVQAAITNISRIEEVARIGDHHRRAWRPDPILDDCFILENLDVRKFFALFAISDLFVGTNSGGAHVAAAMNVPAVVVLPASKYPHAPIFPDRVPDLPWRHESFLYPQQTFLLQA